MKPVVIDNIDLELLKQQKQVLLGFVWPDSRHVLTDKEKEAIDGIINLLDSIHDELDPPGHDSDVSELENCIQCGLDKAEFIQNPEGLIICTDCYNGP